MSSGICIRDARDDDGPALIDLIGSIFAEYPGCVLDVDGEAPELRAIATHFAHRRGLFWVVEDWVVEDSVVEDSVTEDGDAGVPAEIVGCVGFAPSAEPRTAELFKLYVAARARRRGLGSRLCDLVEAESARQGMQRLQLWSDTRFEDAHRLYTGRGMQRQPETRELLDKSDTVEFRFTKDLPG